jgi:hypothetical protein
MSRAGSVANDPGQPENRESGQWDDPRLANLPPELWPGVLPYGQLAVLLEPAAGQSLVAASIAVGASQHSDVAVVTPVPTIFTERVRAGGGTTVRCHVARPAEHWDAKTFRQRLRDGVKVAIIDPLSEIVTSAEGERGRLRELAILAEEMDVTIIVVASRLAPRTLEVVPTVISVGDDEHDHRLGRDRDQVLTVEKYPWRPSGPVRFRVVGERVPAIEWLGTVDSSAESRWRGERLSEAIAWLRELLTEAGGEMPRNDVEKATKQADMAWRTVRRAQACLGVTSRRVRGETGDFFNVWSLPTEDVDAAR